MLSPRSLGRFCIITVCSHSLVIDEHVVHSTVSIDHATHALQIAISNTDGTFAHPSRRSVNKRTDTNNSNPCMGTTQQNIFHNQRIRTQSSKHRSKVAYANTQLVSPMRHIGSGRNIKCVIRRYDYSANDGTIKLPDHTPQHFIARYLSRKKNDKTTDTQSYSFQVAEEAALTHIKLISIAWQKFWYN